MKTVLTSQGPRDQNFPWSNYKTLITCRNSTKGQFVRCGCRINTKDPRDQKFPWSNYKTLITCRSCTKGQFVRCGCRINTKGRSRVIKGEVGGVNPFRGLCTEYTARTVRTEMTQTHRPAVICKGTSIFQTPRHSVSSVRTLMGQ